MATPPVSRSSSASGLLATSLKPAAVTRQITPTQVVPPWINQMSARVETRQQALRTFNRMEVTDVDSLQGWKGAGTCAPEYTPSSILPHALSQSSSNKQELWKSAEANGRGQVPFIESTFKRGEGVFSPRRNAAPAAVESSVSGHVAVPSRSTSRHESQMRFWTHGGRDVDTSPRRKVGQFSPLSPRCDNSTSAAALADVLGWSGGQAQQTNQRAQLPPQKTQQQFRASQVVVQPIPADGEDLSSKSMYWKRWQESGSRDIDHTFKRRSGECSPRRTPAQGVLPVMPPPQADDQFSKESMPRSVSSLSLPDGKRFGMPSGAAPEVNVQTVDIESGTRRKFGEFSPRHSNSSPRRAPMAVDGDVDDSRRSPRSFTAAARPKASDRRTQSPLPPSTAADEAAGLQAVSPRVLPADACSAPPPKEVSWAPAEVMLPAAALVAPVAATAPQPESQDSLGKSPPNKDPPTSWRPSIPVRRAGDRAEASRSESRLQVSEEQPPEAQCAEPPSSRPSIRAPSPRRSLFPEYASQEEPAFFGSPLQAYAALSSTARNTTTDERPLFPRKAAGQYSPRASQPPPAGSLSPRSPGQEDKGGDWSPRQSSRLRSARDHSPPRESHSTADLVPENAKREAAGIRARNRSSSLCGGAWRNERHNYARSASPVAANRGNSPRRFGQDLAPTTLGECNPGICRGLPTRVTLESASAMKNQSPRSPTSKLPIWQPPLWRNDSIIELKSSHSKASLITSGAADSCRSSRAELHEVSSKASTEFFAPQPSKASADFAPVSLAKKHAARALAEKVNSRKSTISATNSAAAAAAAGRNFGGTGGTGDVPLPPTLRINNVHRSKSSPHG